MIGVGKAAIASNKPTPIILPIRENGSPAGLHVSLCFLPSLLLVFRGCNENMGHPHMARREFYRMELCVAFLWLTWEHRLVYNI